MLTCQYCNKEFKVKRSITIHERSCEFNPQKIHGATFGRVYNHPIEIKKKNAKSYSRSEPPENIMCVSSRTMVKILKRLNKGCSNCGWNEAACDVHHILPKKQKGTDDHSNLTLICPNCHRLAHSKKLVDFISLREYIGEEWRKHYYSTTNG